MFKICIDTSVWLDLAKEPNQSPIIQSLHEMIDEGRVKLIVPRVVMDEFQRNKEKIAKGAQERLTQKFREVKQAIRTAEKNTRVQKRMIQYLSEIDHKIPLTSGQPAAYLHRLEKMMSKAGVVETSNSAKVKAAERALAKLAPCHQGKNSIGDAIIVETYFEQVAEGRPGDRFMFVTHNKKDFSDLNQKKPHPAIAGGFTRVRSRYFINLSECLNRIDPLLVQQVTWEASLNSEVRLLSEIDSALHTLWNQVWYNRHRVRQDKIDRGEIKLVTKDEWEDAFDENGYEEPENMIGHGIWEGALVAAARVASKLGPNGVGPWDDFEWGMINGKLSAIRWVLGDDWDNLDT